MPEAGAEVQEVPIVRGEAVGILATCDTRGHDPELLAEAAELLGELGAGVGLRHGVGEAVVEDVEIAGEDEALRPAPEKALEEPDLVGLRPDSMEFEGRGLQIVAAASASAW